jgi:hypothetical protein
MKNLWLFIILFFSVSALFAQDEDEDTKGFQKDKLFFGGNFGLSFGNYTLINISPQLGYRFNKNLAAGAGINLIYSSIKERYVSEPYKMSQGITGLNIFGRVYPVQFIMLQAQPELNYRFGNIRYLDTDEKYKLDAEIVPSLLLGGGAVVPSGRGSFIAALFYDVWRHVSSPYGKRPVVNFGYNVGF